MLHHFILTRFNIRLFRHDKHGHSIEPKSWFEERLNLFETYTLPSIMGQTCQEFTWILLVDSETPAAYRERMMEYRRRCPQITFIGVKEQYGWKFPLVFQKVVNKLLKEKAAQDGDFCLTTYFDNDDCLNKNYIKDIHDRMQAGSQFPQEEGFLVYDYGIQFFAEMGTATRVKYPNNHFITLYERIASGQNPSVRTCYGYGSHIDIEKRKAAPVRHVTDADKPMWIEVIHKGNVDNDVMMTLNTRFVKDKQLLRTAFSLDVELQTGKKMKFFKRSLKQAWRRFHDRLFPRKW